MGKPLPDIDELRRQMTNLLGDVVDEMFDTFEHLVEELERREAAVSEREKDVAEMMREVEVLKSDREATDTSVRYVASETYEVDDVTYVVASEMPDRERHILATLQMMAGTNQQGQRYVEASNKEIVKAASTLFDPLTVSAISACLTRLTHKDLISVVHLNGRGYPRHIVLNALLEAPEEFTPYSP
jgi:hypothetical protein